MVQGIQKQADLLQITEDQLQYFLPTFKLDKPSISKSLLKSIYWALSLPNSKVFSLQIQILLN
jgi:hypothetical protein